MPLNNTAKIGDIITVLQDIQGINQKADLKSALVAKGLEALDTDNVAELISKLNSANLVLNGKKWASGTIQSNVSDGFVTVNNLSFTPSFVLIWDNNIDATFNLEVIVLFNNVPYNFGDSNHNIFSMGLDKKSNGTMNTKFKTDKSYINASGFSYQMVNTNRQYNWIAIE